MKILNRDVPDIVAILVLGCAVRLIVAPFFSDTFDFAYWTATVFDVRVGDGLYGEYDFWYPPVWGYVMSLIAPLMDLFNIVPSQELFIGMADDDLETGDGWVASIGALVLIKLPLIAADVVNGLLIYKIALKLTSDGRKALVAAALWMFNPLSIWVSSGQGQFDTLALMFVLLCVWSYLERSYLLCGISLATATLTKVFPAFMVLPMLALILSGRDDRRVNLKGGCLYAVGGIAMAVLILLPQIVNGEMEFVMSFLTGRLFGSQPVPSGFDPLAMSFFSDYLYPQPDRSTYLIPSAIAVLIMTVYMMVRRCDTRTGMLLLTASLCVYLMWPPAPGYPQYYILPVGMLCMCSCLDRRFGHLALASGIIGVLPLLLSFEHAAPMVVMGLIDIDTLYAVTDVLESVFGIFHGFFKFLRFVPMLLAIIMVFNECRRRSSEA